MKSVVGVREWLLLLLAFLLVAPLNAQEISKKRGQAILHYENGARWCAGRVDNFRKNGLWKYWDEEGVLHHTVIFLNDTLHGRYIEYYRDGKVLTFGNFHKGFKEGCWRTYYPDQRILSENWYREGQLHGEQQAWYSNGDVKEIVLCSYDQVVSRKVWYPGGRLKTIESYHDGSGRGKWIAYPDPIAANDTFPSSISELFAGELHGWHYAFLNGRKMEEVHYVAGEPDGSCTRWDEHGHLISQEQFDCGQREGKCRYYNCNGILREMTFADGMQSGPQVDFDHDGDTLSVSWFSRNKRDSLKTYYENGSIASSRVYEIAADLSVHCAYTEFDENGLRLVGGTLINNVRNGWWYTYYASGAPRSATMYKDGAIVGKFIKWYENGNRMIEFNINEDGSYTEALVSTENGLPIPGGTTRHAEIVQSTHPGETYVEPATSRAIIDKHITDLQPSYLQFIAVDDSEEAPIVIRGSVGDAINHVAPIPSPPIIKVEAEADPLCFTAEVKPQFPGGDLAMQKFISNHLVHPPKRFHMYGTVLVSFIVEKDGSITNPIVVREVFGAPEFSDEALRIVHLFPDMEPGMKDGKPVRTKVIVPIEFSKR